MAKQLFNYTREHFNEIKDNYDITYIADIVDDYLDVIRVDRLVFNKLLF